MPAVSVIIPTFNRWPMAGEAVDSVLGQTYRDFELIVVDDGSSDGTAEKLLARHDGVRIIRQPHKGVSAARNAGARAAAGRYLAFLDSDDLWLPDKLALQHAFLESRPELKICQTEEIWIRRGIRVNPRKKHRKLEGDIFHASLDLCLVSPSAVMITGELFRKLGGFDESLPVCEDYDLWLRIAADHSIGLLPRALIIKRGGHADQLSTSLWGMDRYRIAALVKLLRDGLGGEKRRWSIEALQRKTAVLSRGARKRGREEEAKSYELVAAEFAPSIEESLHAGGRDPRIRESQGNSSRDIAPLAHMAGP
jgi:glycosyltransferase involved in cell wall biosynthesis